MSRRMISRLDRLQRRLGQFPCECRSAPIPIVEVAPGETVPEDAGLPERCPACGRRAPVRLVIVERQGGHGGCA